MDSLVGVCFQKCMVWCAAIVMVLAMNARTVFSQGMSAPGSVGSRTEALARILAEYHEEQIKREPELATAAGDGRYNVELPDFSASAENTWIAHGQSYIVRLSEIDTTGVPDSVRLAAERLLNSLLDEQEATHVRQWQMPLTQFTTLNTRLLALAAHLPFASGKDYDDYVLRLRKLPFAFSQIMTNLQLNLDQGRVPARSEVMKVQAEVQAVTSAQNEANPYAAPLARVPATITTADRKRISADLLDTISTAVIPAYQRLGRFVAAMPMPSEHVNADGATRALVGQ